MTAQGLQAPRTLEADFQPLNHGLNSAWRLAQDLEDDGGSSCKRPRSSRGLARDDDDEDEEKENRGPFPFSDYANVPWKILVGDFLSFYCATLRRMRLCTNMSSVWLSAVRLPVCDVQVP